MVVRGMADKGILGTGLALHRRRDLVQPWLPDVGEAAVDQHHIAAQCLAVARKPRDEFQPGSAAADHHDRGGGARCRGWCVIQCEPGGRTRREVLKVHGVRTASQMLSPGTGSPDGFAQRAENVEIYSWPRCSAPCRATCTPRLGSGNGESPATYRLGSA